ncbi:MAG: DNA-processing protein DprA [Prevotella sp.]|nr:DNA-processing protein DprA [Prevotella sp.]
MNEQEKINAIALTQLSYISLAAIRELLRLAGSATEVMDNRTNLRDILPDISAKMERAIACSDEALRKAEAEYAWATDNGVTVLPISSPDYPQRLAECPDAPAVLYFKGNGNLNHKKIISVVGTRHCTIYGHDFLRNLMAGLRAYTEVLVVSGLAYGIDIIAHREALDNGFPTVAVLAHGLDQLYPSCHRDTAKKMLSQGGLLTEYPSQTTAMKGNFVQRNRIVAGLSDCTLLVESAAKGGGLITMTIARDYNRDTFAVPGAVNAEYSRGCNNLIRDNCAALVNDADDLVKAMGWDDEQKLGSARQEGIPRQLFDNLDDDEAAIVKILQDTGDQQVNVLTVKSGIPISKLLPLLFNLEMKGIVRALAGGNYHLL